MKILPFLFVSLIGCAVVDSEPVEYVDINTSEITSSPPAEVPTSPASDGEAASSLLQISSEQAQILKPVVIYYCAENCPPCIALENDICGLTDDQIEQLPFRFSKDGRNPDWVESFPALHWKTKQGWVSISGWHGIDQFREIWEKSQGLVGGKKKESTSSRLDPSIGSNSGNFSWASEPRSGDRIAPNPFFQSVTESGLLSTKKQH